MKIIDFEKKGNVVKFYLGISKDFTGDDWNDAPYDCNAERVSSEYILGTMEVMFPYDYSVREPKEPEWERHSWTKDDMKNRKVPCIVAKRYPEDESEDYFDKVLADSESLKVYFGDDVADVKSLLYSADDKIVANICLKKF